MKNVKIGIIGVGNLGSSIALGLKKAGFGKILVSDVIDSNLHKMKEEGIAFTKDNSLLVSQSDVVILAVKPFKASEILLSFKNSVTSQIIVSVVSGFSIADIQSSLNDSVSVFRAMPNTAIAIQESITCLSGVNFSENQKGMVDSIFKSLGETVDIDESLMDAATVLGACGIAYVMRFIRGMMQGGIEIGFDAKAASKIATQTVKGAAELLIKNNTHPESEIDKVTTPKGCTIAGLNEMEHQGFSSSLIKGITTSFEKI